jgi:hypothetical protein
MSEHPFWPNNWQDIYTIAGNENFAKSWGFDKNGDFCYLESLYFGRPQWRVSYQVISVTLLPDDLLWLRLIRCPDGFDGGNDGGCMTYCLMSTEIYQRYAANRVQAIAWNGKKWVNSRRYRWSAQIKFATYVPPDPEVFKRLAESLMHAFAEGKSYP